MRIAPLDALHRGGDYRLIDQLGRRVFCLDDVAVGRNEQYRRRQVHVEAANRPRALEAVVDNDDLAAALIAADTAQQPSVAIIDRDDLRVIRTHHHGAHVVARADHADIASADAEAIDITVPDE